MRNVIIKYGKNIRILNIIKCMGLILRGEKHDIANSTINQAVW